MWSDLPYQVPSLCSGCWPQRTGRAHWAGLQAEVSVSCELIWAGSSRQTWPLCPLPCAGAGGGSSGAGQLLYVRMCMQVMFWVGERE